MNHSFPFLCLLVALGDSTSAQVPRSEVTSGKVLVLENDRLLEGEIDKVGSQYRIRRGAGELWIPVNRAKRLCKDQDEAYLLMQSFANVRDPDERLRLARWCQLHGLKNHALTEARAALDMRPEHGETMHLIQLLQRQTNVSSALPAAPTAAPAPIVPVSRPTPVPASSRVMLDVSQEAFAQFAARVQPVLINTCYTCHQAAKGTTFQLVRPSDGGYRGAAQKNLNAVLEYVNFERTVLSPLLIKAVVPHGGAQDAPVKGRQSAPFQAIQIWVEQTVAQNPHLRELRRAEEATQLPVFGISTSAKRTFAETPSPVEKAPPPVAPATKIAPPPPMVSNDPFDPAEFNRKVAK